LKYAVNIAKEIRNENVSRLYPALVAVRIAENVADRFWNPYWQPLGGYFQKRSSDAYNVVTIHIAFNLSGYNNIKTVGK
jgi:hypothetical protein